MSKRDYRVTLRQIEEYAGRAQEIGAGKTLDELVGENGSGKTTFVKLLTRL